MNDREEMLVLSRAVGAALASGDLEAYAELLDPDVRWGPPGDPSPPCRNRRQVLDWYQRGRDAGARADVIELRVGADQILVGLRVSGREMSGANGGTGSRWQLLTVRGGRVSEIVGFESRADAVAFSSTGFEEP